VRRFWRSVVHPLLELVQPEAILEIGAAGGRHTRVLADYCRKTGATLHVIEPEPRFDAEALVRDGRVVLHRDLSLNVLPSLPAVDIVLVDGDHNWYTVFNELRQLQRAAREGQRPMPVVLCHDVGWPYGRRDMYYFPETIPEEFRHPWERRGMAEGQSELVPEGGQNPNVANACFEGGPRNGVLTAIEDFLGEANEEISIRVTPSNYDLAVLVPKTRSPDGRLEATIERLLESEPRPKTPRRARPTAQQIPKVIHRVWLGSNPISEPFELYAESWRKHHPEWELRLWRDETLPPISLGDVLDELEDGRWRESRPLTAENRPLITWRARYDIVRLEILRQFGGVIVDMDVEAIRPLDPLLRGVTAFAGRTRDSHSLKIGNQVLGAAPGHPFLEYVVERIRELGQVARNANQLAGHAFLTRAINERPEGVTIFPRDTFYSLLTIEPPKRPAGFPQIYAVHHHLQSYLGPEGETARHERNLRAAQLELERLYVRLDRAGAENARLRSRLARAEQLSEAESG
jgi:hypothetical protein